MRLSEVEGFNEENLILAKFTSAEFVQDFLNGNLYMNNFNHFIEQEKNSNHKGQGDSFEAAFVTEVRNIKIYDNRTNQLIANGNMGNLIERYEYFKKTPLFCLASFSSKNFEVIKQDEDSISFKLDIPNEDKNRFRNDFNSDTVALTFSPTIFIKRLIDGNQEINGDLRYGAVDYVDYSVMDKKRRENFEKGTADFLFTKHHSLSYQREFRVILPNIQSDFPYIFNIGNLEDIFSAVTIDQFLDECYIQINFKK